MRQLSRFRYTYMAVVGAIGLLTIDLAHTSNLNSNNRSQNDQKAPAAEAVRAAIDRLNNIDFNAIKDEKTIVGKVGEQEFTIADVVQKMRDLGPALQKMPLALAFRMALEQLIQSHILEDSANKRKEAFLKKPAVQEDLKKAQRAVILQALLKEVAEKAVSSAAEEKEYMNILKFFKEATKEGPDEVKVRQIIIRSEAEAKKVIEALQAKTQDFMKLARERSIDESTRKQDGDLGFINIIDARRLPAAYQLLFKKKDGKYVIGNGQYYPNPLRIKDGEGKVAYVIFKVEKRRPFTLPKFNDLKPSIQQKLREEAVQKFIQGMMKTYKIERLHPNTGKAMLPLEEELKRIQDSQLQKSPAEAVKK